MKCPPVSFFFPLRNIFVCPKVADTPNLQWKMMINRVKPKDFGVQQKWLVFFNIFFPYIGNNNPNWRTHIFQRGRYTTNQKNIFWIWACHWHRASHGLGFHPPVELRTWPGAGGRTRPMVLQFGTGSFLASKINFQWFIFQIPLSG